MRAVLLPLLGFAGLVAVPSAPAVAQVADRVIIVYGNDPCPASQGQEIVVCRRQPRNEQYRIPRDLRESEVAPQKLGSSQVMAVNSTGGNAAQVQSCNAVGAGVNAGCWKKQIDAAHAERRHDEALGADVP